MKKKIYIDGTNGKWDWRQMLLTKMKEAGIDQKYDIYMANNEFPICHYLGAEYKPILECDLADIHIFIIANPESSSMNDFVEAARIAFTKENVFVGIPYDNLEINEYDKEFSYDDIHAIELLADSSHSFLITMLEDIIETLK